MAIILFEGERKRPSYGETSLCPKRLISNNTIGFKMFKMQYTSFIRMRSIT